MVSFRKAIDQARTRYVPGLVRAKSTTSCGAFTYAPSTLGQLTRAMEVDRRFADAFVLVVHTSNPDKS